jgi:hypothetical protein
MFTRVRVMRFPLVVVSALSIGVACGGDDSGSAAETSPVSADSSPDTSVAIAESTTLAPVESMRGKRYCEILLLAPTDAGIVATVYNTFPLGDCPADEWAALDTPAIAQAEGAIFALANGPRYWLMDEVGRDTGDVITKTFGTIPMNRYATVTITDPKSVGTPFTPQKVDRKATFTFRAGQTIYVLTADDGRRFVMQSWSQQREPSLAESDLAELGPRLDLPAGWTYGAETLTEDLVVGADRLPAEVLQDNLLDSYSLIN